jgi:hypothetical protein
MERVWLVMSGTASEREVLCACPTEADAVAIIARLKAALLEDHLNEPRAVPILTATTALEAITRVSYVVELGLDGRETSRFTMVSGPDDVPEGGDQTDGLIIGWSPHSYDAALKAALTKTLDQGMPSRRSPLV